MHEEVNFFEIPHPNLGVKILNSKKKITRRHRGVCFSKGIYITLVTVFLLLVIATFSSIIYLSSMRSYICKNHSRPTLVKVFVSFSHGSKAPDYTYAGNEYSSTNLTLWPGGPGELTQRGKRESYELGKRLKERYGEFLGDFYNPGEVRAYSTPVRRAKVTGQLVMSALFPTPDFQLDSDQPAFKVIPQKTDYLANAHIGSICPLIDVELKRTIEKEIASLSPENTRIISAVVERAREPSAFVSLNKFWDVIYFQEKEGLSLPYWIKEIYPEKITSLYMKILKKYVDGSDLLKKLVLHKYASSLKNFLMSKDNKKMESHSWHALNQLVLMHLLGVQVETYPEPASCIVIEVHSRGGQNVVEVYYYENSGVKEPRMLDMACGRSCLLSNLEDIVEYQLLENYDEVCHSAKGNALNLTPNFIFL